MKISSAALENLRTTVRHEFNQGLNERKEKETWPKVASSIPSSGKSNTYAFLSAFPQMREWVGDRQIQSIKENGHEIPNKKYESTLEVGREDIEDDNLALYKTLAKAKGEEVSTFFDRNIFRLLSKGFRTLCYDGQNFFDTDHPVNSKTDGTGADSSVSNIIGSSSSKGDAWYLLDSSRVLKPLILQERKKPEMEDMTSAEADHVFMKDKFLYGIRWRGAFAFGPWQFAAASKEDLTEDNFNAAYQQMMSVKQAGGDPLGVIPTTLVVPPSLRAAASAVVKTAQKTGGATNTNYKAVELIVSPWL